MDRDSEEDVPSPTQRASTSLKLDHQDIHRADSSRPNSPRNSPIPPGTNQTLPTKPTKIVRIPIPKQLSGAQPTESLVKHEPDHHASEFSRDHVDMKSPTPSPLTSPPDSPRLTAANEASLAESKNASNIDVTEQELFHQENEPTLKPEQYHPTSEFDAETTELDEKVTETPADLTKKREDSEVDRLTKRVKTIIQGWESLTEVPQTTSGRSRTVYQPTEHIKAILKKMNESAADAMMSVEEVEKLMDLHTNGRGIVSPENSDLSNRFSAFSEAQVNQLSEQLKEKQDSFVEAVFESMDAGEDDGRLQNDPLLSSRRCRALSELSRKREDHDKLSDETGKEQEATPSSTTTAASSVQDVLSRLVTKAEADTLHASSKPGSDMREFEKESSKRRKESRIGKKTSVEDDHTHKATSPFLMSSLVVDSPRQVSTAVPAAKENMSVEESSYETQRAELQQQPREEKDRYLADCILKGRGREQQGKL